jgi:hypothetical protein
MARTSMSTRTSLRALGAAGAALITTLGLAADVASGLAAGTPTASIPVLDVTGAYAGKRICYVCEFQDDPNVLAFFQHTGADTAHLIEALNSLYVANKDKNFKAVAMIVAGPDAQAWLEELNASGEIEIPLTVFYRGPRDVAAKLYALNPDVENTFLVTRNRFVVANVSGIGADGFDRVADATKQMLAAAEQTP